HAALRKGATSPAQLLAASHREGTTAVLDAQMDAVRGSVPDGALRGVTEAFAISYALLDEGAKRLACMIAWLAPAPVPSDLLVRLSTDTMGAASRVAVIDRGFVLEARYAGGTGASGWQMHRVLGDFLRTRDAHPVDSLVSGLTALAGVLGSLNL